MVGGFLVGVTETSWLAVSFIGTELKLTVSLAMIIIVLLVKPSRPVARDGAACNAMEYPAGGTAAETGARGPRGSGPEGVPPRGTRADRRARRCCSSWR